MINKRADRITNVVDNRQRDILIVLEDIHDPHNAAAILRTCDALGIQNVWFVFEQEKPYNPKRVGKATSSSANKWLDFRTFSSTADCITALKRDGYTIVTTGLTEKSVSLPDFTVGPDKLAIILGNEHRGVSQPALESADVILKIPMLGFVQSLNVSVAAAIILWEITRQRLVSGKNWRLEPEDHTKLLGDLMERGKKK